MLLVRHISPISFLYSLGGYTTRAQFYACIEVIITIFHLACRGSLKDSGVDADDDEMEPEQRVLSSSGIRVATDSDSKIPSAEDFYFGYATASGHVAWRDLDNGSWYVSELCRSLASYAKFASLNDMMTITNKRVSTTYSNLEFKQATEATSRLGNDVFFF